MASKLRLVLASIALLAQVAGAPSWLAAASLAAPDQPATQSDCCSTEGETSDCEVPPDTDDCCPDGCQHCPLSCCGGAPALTSAYGAVLRAPAGSPARLIATPMLFPHSDPREIYHPPRA